MMLALKAEAQTFYLFPSDSTADSFGPARWAGAAPSHSPLPSMEQAVGVGLQEGLDGRQTHAKLERRNTAPFGPGMLSSKAERLLANYMLNSSSSTN